MKVKLHIDKVGYKRKPTSITAGAITKRIVETVSEVTPEELAEVISKGQTVVCATMDGAKRKENMIQQQVVMLDFDNTEKVDDKKVKTAGLFYTSLNQVLADPFIKDNAAFAYKTLSYKDEWEKFRVVFFLDKALTSNEQVGEVYKQLLEKYPTADKAIKNSDRLFYGGIEIIEINYNNTLEVKDIDNVPVKKVTKVKEFVVQSKKKTNTDSKPNWELIKEGNTDELKQRFAEYGVTLNSKPQAVNYLKTLDLAEILGINENPFCDIMKGENNPSCSIFKMDNSNIYLYKNFSEDKCYDIISITENLRGVSYIEAVKFVINIFNIKIEVTEQIKEIREQCDLFLNLMVSEDFKLQFPAINNIFWRYKTDIYTLLNIFKENIYETRDGQIRSLTWMSVRTLSMKLYDTEDKFKKVSDLLNLLAYTNWIEKLDSEKIPEELLEQIRETQIKNQRQRRSNVFELLLLSDDFFVELNKQCEVMKASGFTRKGFSKEYVERTNGKAVADTVFVQDKNRTISKVSDAFTMDIHKTTLKMIDKYGYAVEKEVIEKLQKKWRNKGFTEYKFKQAVSEMIDLYSLERKRLTKDLKKELGLDPSSKSMPVIFVKAKSLIPQSN